jgi:hypothetical protein
MEENIVNAFDSIVSNGYNSITIKEAHDLLGIKVFVVDKNGGNMSIDDNDNNSCEARIESNMKNREAYLESIYDAIDSESEFEGYDDARDALNELPLDISKYEVVKILLSTGGPGDWLEVFVDANNGGKVIRVEYHFNDWFDYASRDVSSSSYLWQYASEIVETLYY